MKDTDWLYKAFSIPWLSDDPVNLVEVNGVGFEGIFGETVALDAVTSLSVGGWQFVAYWKPEFAGWNGIAFVVFRKRIG